MKGLVKIALCLTLLLHSLQITEGPVPQYVAPPLPFMDYLTKRCIANALWYEARGESIEGQRAVLDTIFNRQLKSGKSACSVITAPAQFSWYSGLLKPYTQEMKHMLERVRDHPRILRDENYRFFFSGEPPYWASKMACTRIGNHNFCRETT